MNDKIIELPLSFIHEKCIRQMKKMSGTEEGRAEVIGEKRLTIENRKNLNIYTRYFAGKKLSIIIRPIHEIKNKLCEDGFMPDGENFIKCEVMKKIDASSICGGCVFLLKAPEIKEDENSANDILRINMWQTAILDAGRDWLKEYLEKEESDEEHGADEFSEAENGRKIYVTDSFGPGFYGMDIDSMKYLYEFVQGEKIGVIISESGFLMPEKCVIGIHLYLTEKNMLPPRDCQFCKAESGGCEFCKNY